MEAFNAENRFKANSVLTIRLYRVDIFELLRRSISCYNYNEDWFLFSRLNGNSADKGDIMKSRQLGSLTVSEIGMGCMAFSHGYGQIPPEQYSIEAIRNAYDHGCTFFLIQPRFTVPV